MRAREPAEVVERLRSLGPAAVVVDVEPLVALWDTDESDLHQGVDAFLKLAVAVNEVGAVCFSTNSSRDIVGKPQLQGLDVSYISSAWKPLRVHQYRDLPVPGVVIGDQVATDGLLAWRLGFSFIHYCPVGGRPLGPRLMGMVGTPLRRILFVRDHIA